MRCIFTTNTHVDFHFVDKRQYSNDDDGDGDDDHDENKETHKKKIDI